MAVHLQVAQVVDFMAAQLDYALDVASARTRLGRARDGADGVGGGLDAGCDVAVNHAGRRAGLTSSVSRYLVKSRE